MRDKSNHPPTQRPKIPVHPPACMNAEGDEVKLHPKTQSVPSSRFAPMKWYTVSRQYIQATKETKTPCSIASPQCILSYDP